MAIPIRPASCRVRHRVRSFLAVHTAAGAPPSADDPRGDRALDEALAFQRAVHAAGLAGLSVSPADAAARSHHSSARITGGWCC